MKVVGRVKVRGFHVDVFMHVNHARYLEFFEEGRWAYAEQNHHVGDLLKRLQENGIVHMVVNVNISYKSGATLGDTLRIETDLMKAENKNYVMLHRAFIDETGRLAASAEVTTVFVDMKFGKVIEINEEIMTGWPELGRLLRDEQKAVSADS